MSFKQEASQIMRGFFIFLMLSVLVSCVSVSNLTTEKERTVTSTSIKDIAPQWAPFADGIDYFHGDAASPKIKFRALRINLYAPGVEIVVKGGADGENNGGFLGAKVSSFVRDNNLAAGINASPFDVSSSKEGQPIKNIGIVVSEGKLLSPANSRYDALVFYRDGKAAIVSQASIVSTENIENAVGGFYRLLLDGEPTRRAKEDGQDENAARHPRSAAGISTDGKYLYLLVIDGRQAASIGATEPETAALLSALGSHNAINFDGGGSSALALKFPDGKVKVVNTPVHKIFPGEERAVASCLGVRIE